MIFENPDILWLLLIFPPLLCGLGIWGWKEKRKVTVLFPSVGHKLWIKQVKKYILFIVLIELLIITFALPKIAYVIPINKEKTGEIILLVDVTRSMAAQKDFNSRNRLERVKPILYEIIDDMEKLGQIRIALYGFTDIARSHVPFVETEDYNYLKESIKKVLDINSTPGSGTSIGKSIRDVADKFPEDSKSKIIIVFSDGEPFWWDTKGMSDRESAFIEQAVKKIIADGIKIVIVGVGESEGAKIPIYNNSGEFTGEYVLESLGVYYTSFFEEDILKELASQMEGEYFYEGNLGGLNEVIEKNLVQINTETTTEKKIEYHYVTNWFLLISLLIWVIFVRGYLLD